MAVYHGNYTLINELCDNYHIDFHEASVFDNGTMITPLYYLLSYRIYTDCPEKLELIKMILSNTSEADFCEKFGELELEFYKCNKF